MTMITSGENWKGEPCEISFDGNLLKNLEKVKEVVTTKDFDFVGIVAGMPGAGKSNFSINVSKYFCPWFDKSYMCFTADQFIETTSTCPKNSAVILDESFASFNTKVGLSKAFLKIVNHLQLIRQRNLFILLNLPNFFDLSKAIAIYRSNFLFVCYGEEFGKRGSFSAYDRELKKQLYIRGAKYMDYICVKPNFRGRFFRQHVIDPEVYESMKLEHLRRQEKDIMTETATIQQHQRDQLINFNFNELKVPVNKISEIINLTPRAIYNLLKKVKEQEEQEQNGN